MTKKEEINRLKMLTAYEVVRINPTIEKAIQERIEQLRKEIRRNGIK